MNPDPDDDSSLCSVDLDGSHFKDRSSSKIWIETGNELLRAKIVLCNCYEFESL